MNLIIIEDEKELAISMKVNLSKYNIKADIALSGHLGLGFIRKNNYDLVILDLNLPDLTGDKICKVIRGDGFMMPILILSGDGSLRRKIDLLNLGADDYLNKPFDMAELVSRIKALLRRPNNIAKQIIKIGNLELDRQKQKLRITNKEIYLTRTEFLILEYLMIHPATVISRSELIEHVWEDKINLFSKTTEMHMVNLRKKIELDKNKPLIKTISGRGYKFN